MCGFISEVLNTIKEPFICTMDGVTKEYENGTIAVDGLKENLKVTHSIEKIGMCNGKIGVIIVDQQQEISVSNKVWMAAQKEKTGIEPSFF